MNQERKPAGADDPAQNSSPPSRETYQIARDVMAETVLQIAEEHGRVAPSSDPAERGRQALRELRAYLQEGAAIQRRRKEVQDQKDAPHLREADILPPLSFVPELSDIDPPRAPQVGGGDTETLLNGLIAECHFLMREVAFRTICDSRDPLDRLRFLEATQSMMRAGAIVGDSIARLRHGPVKQIRQSFVHEETRTAPPATQGEGPR